jgi:predicted kinase
MRPAKSDGSYYVIIRGPLGVGKSTVARRVATRVRGEYISIDRILEEQELWQSGRLSEFLRANEFAAARASKVLAKGTPVIFDGNFYWRTQIQDLIGRLRYAHHVFTLRAPLRICIDRDGRRDHPYGDQAAREVYAKSTRFDYGVRLDARGSAESVVRAIVSSVSPPDSKGGR